MFRIRTTDMEMNIIKQDDTIGQWSEREVTTPEGAFTELYFITESGKETVSGLIKVTDSFLSLLKLVESRSSGLGKMVDLNNVGESVKEHASRTNVPLYYADQACFDLKESLTWRGKIDRWKGRKDRLYNEWLRAHYAKAIEEENIFSIETLYLGLKEDCSIFTWPSNFRYKAYIGKFAENMQRKYKDSQTLLGSIYEHGL